MTTEEIRIAVAELCGWTVIDGVYPRDCGYPPGHPQHKQEERAPLPNYPADLNACAEFEKTLTDEEFDRYVIILWDKIADTEEAQKPGRNALSCFVRGSTALQRCEAFLRVKGKWVEIANADQGGAR